MSEAERELSRCRQLLSEILHTSYVGAFSGGYVATYGPITCSRIVEQVRKVQPDHPTIKRWETR